MVSLVTSNTGCGIADGAIEPVEGAHDVALPIDVADRHGLTEGHDLERLAKPRDLFEVGQRHGRDPIAAVVLELDEPVRDQSRERLPQGAEADLEAFPHLRQVDLRARLQLA